jgi:hypothetical protein
LLHAGNTNNACPGIKLNIGFREKVEARRARGARRAGVDECGTQSSKQDLRGAIRGKLSCVFDDWA